MKDLIGTSEEWWLRYYDDGLRPLGELVKDAIKKRVPIPEEDPMKPIFDNLRRSSIVYQSIFSMAKIKNEQKVPEYLLRLMSPVMTDGWFGDSSNAEECNKYSCQLAVGEDQVFYFNFKKGYDYSSIAAAPAGNAFKFCSFFLRQNEEWFVKDGLTEKDFNMVLNVVNGKQVDDAINILWMVKAGVANPLSGSSI